MALLLSIITGPCYSFNIFSSCFHSVFHTMTHARNCDWQKNAQVNNTQGGLQTRRTYVLAGYATIKQLIIQTILWNFHAREEAEA